MRSLAPLLLVAGCRQLLGFDDPTRVDAASTRDASIDAQACTQNVDCTQAQAPVCNLGTGTCRGCVAHTECASDACTPTGACAATTDVAYVAPSGSGSACSMAMPCATVSAALATGLPYVKLTGSLSENVTIDSDVTVLADPGTDLEGATTGPVVSIVGAANVAIFDLEVSGGIGTNGAGIAATSGMGGTITLTRMTISSNEQYGILVSRDTLVLQRSTVSDNLAGGVMTMNLAGYDIENNFIVSNGSSNSPVGGVQLAPMGATQQVFQFNTVASNTSNVQAAGVTCQSMAATLSNNIIYGNGSSSQVSGCSSTYSDIGPSGTASSSVINLSPQFVSSTDFHIQSSSPCRDSADPFATLPIDIDGDTRPYGPARDMGADEVIQ